MGLSGFSERLTAVITKELDYSEDQKEVVAYGIESLVLAIIGFLAILVMAFIFNALVPAAIAAAFGGFLRKLSGGAHFNTPVKCLTLGAIVYSLIGVIAQQVVNFNLYDGKGIILILIVSLIVIGIYAPVDSESKPIHSVSFRRKLKLASLIFVLISLVMVIFSHNSLINTSAVMGVGYQTMTLLPVFNKKKKEV